MIVFENAFLKTNPCENYAEVKDSVDGRNPANQLSLVVYPITYLQGFIHPSRVQDFFHQQCFENVSPFKDCYFG